MEFKKDREMKKMTSILYQILDKKGGIYSPLFH